MSIKPHDEYPEHMRGTHAGRHPWFAAHVQKPMDPLPPECIVTQSSQDDDKKD